MWVVVVGVGVGKCRAYKKVLQKNKKNKKKLKSKKL